VRCCCTIFGEREGTLLGFLIWFAGYLAKRHFGVLMVISEVLEKLGM
jgi:hypothetical protein